MKLPKFVVITGLVTFFSLLYVWQQTEIIRLAYLAQKNQSYFQELLDKNSVLRYNLKRSTSLIHIGSKISDSNDFQIPGSYRLVKLNGLKGETVSPKTQEIKREGVLSRLFQVKAEAQARMVPQANLNRQVLLEH